MNTLASLLILLLCGTCALATIPSDAMITGSFLEVCSPQGTMQWSVALQISQSNLTATYTVYPYSCSSSPGLLLTYSSAYALGPLNQGAQGTTLVTCTVTSIIANSTGFASPAILASLCPDAPALTTRIGDTVDLTSIVCSNLTLAPFNCAQSQKKFSCLVDMSSDLTTLMVGNGTCDSSTDLAPPNTYFARTSNLPAQYIEYSTIGANYAHTNFVPQSASISEATFLRNISGCLSYSEQPLIAGGYLLMGCAGHVLGVNLTSGAMISSDLLSQASSMALSVSGNMVIGYDFEYVHGLRIDSNGITLLWSAPTGLDVGVIAAPVINGQLVYIFNAYMPTFGFNITTGKLVVQTKRNINYISVYNQQLYTSEGNYFCQVDSLTLSKNWCVTLQGPGGNPAIANGIAVVSVQAISNTYPYSSQTILCGISLSDQKTVWQQTYTYGVSQIIAIANNIVYTTTTNTYYNLTTGAVAGVLSPSIYYSMVAITATNDQVFIQDSSYTLHVYSQSTGTQSYSLSPYIYNAVIGEGLLVTSHNTYGNPVAVYQL